MINLSVLYENEEIIIINKPSGLATQGGSGIKHSVDSVLPLQKGFPIFLVHRLDKDTSGLLITAKSSVYAAKWTKLIASKEVKKQYEALCIGTLPDREGYIDEVILQRGIEKKARTLYKINNTYEFECSDGTKQIFSAISLQLDTGRMHQIRIHLAKQNCPIAADDKYGNFKLNKEIKKTLGISRLMLHAGTIEIPLGKSRKTFTADYPPHMSDFSFSGKMLKLQ